MAGRTQAARYTRTALYNVFLSRERAAVCPRPALDVSAGYDSAARQDTWVARLLLSAANQDATSVCVKKLVRNGRPFCVQGLALFRERRASALPRC